MVDIDRLKTLNLAEFAMRHVGFSKASGSTAHAPRLKNGSDVIVITLQKDGHYTFFSPTAGRRGSIWDLVQWQYNLAPKAALDKIAELEQLPQLPGEIFPSCRVGEKKEFDRSKIANLKPITVFAYLHKRGISKSLLSEPRFSGTVLQDPNYHNVIFPHKKDGEIVGYVGKNFKFSGFSEGGEKLFWQSNFFPNDTTMYVGEAAIDLLSVATLLGKIDDCRFVSMDGGTSPEALEALASEIRAMPPDSVIFGAFDNDDQGKKYSATLSDLCIQCQRHYEPHFPMQEGKDWNDILLDQIARHRNQPMTAKQTQTLKKLVAQGALTPIPPERWHSLTIGDAHKLIYTGVQNVKTMAKKSTTESEISI